MTPKQIENAVKATAKKHNLSVSMLDDLPNDNDELKRQRAAVKELKTRGVLVVDGYDAGWFMETRYGRLSWWKLPGPYGAVFVYVEGRK